MDVFPTLLDYIGMEHGAGVDESGVSLRKLIEGGQDYARVIFAESYADLKWA